MTESPPTTPNSFTTTIAQNPSQEDLQLLARLEELNRKLEADAKSLNSLSGTSNHSRRSSDTSQISLSSGSAQGEAEDAEDVWHLWGRVIADWELYSKKKSSFVRDLVRKGIPHHFRGLAWQLLCNAHTSQAREQFAEYMKQTSPCEKVIRRDIARTYPEHEFFKEKDGPGQESLFNVMKAYSLHDREVGYCQGSAFIVGLLLMQMPEEETFAVLVKIMQEYRMREMFKPSMAELGLCMFQLEFLIQELLPELHVHFQSQSFHVSMYASSWFLTLFSTALPLPLAFHIMDLFISEGMEMIFRVAVSILQNCKDQLLSMDMEGMLKFLQKDMPAKFELDSESLLQVAFQVKYNTKKMKKLEKEYTTKRTKEQEEMVEMRRLRTENRLLRQRIECLEQESSSLADRLIQGQVTRAQEAEETFALKRELSALRQQNTELSQHKEENELKINFLEEEVKRLQLLECKDANDLIQVLQEELVNIRLKEAESQAIIKDMKVRMFELEEANKKLRDAPPDNNVAHLQEELIALKLREAETNLSMKELVQRINDLSALWEKHLKENHMGENGKKKDYGKNTILQLQDDLLTARLKEATAVAELKEFQHKVMELESQNHVSLNQVRRLEEEVEKLNSTIESLQSSERDMLQRLKDEERKFYDLESKMKEDLVMYRIGEMERAQNAAELEQRLSSMECKHEEMMAARQLNESDREEVRELQDRVVDLQSEVIRLDALNKKLTGTIMNHNYGGGDKIPVSQRNGDVH
uniref:Rab-GAP TBC domain-containing protein n=1 Tax=Strigamia maritima TaxID=126957 RepID=T1J7S3_STRMM